MKTINLFSVTEETISFKKFVSLTEQEKAAIEAVQILPAKLGQRGFGKIIVRYKTPIYKHNLWESQQNLDFLAI